MPQMAPTLTSFVQSDPALTNASTVHYTLTFSEPVTGVDASDFTLTTSGVTGASITSVNPVAGTNGAQYTVTVNTGSGNGTIALDLVGVSIRDGAGSGLPGGSFLPPVTRGQRATWRKLPSPGYLRDVRRSWRSHHRGPERRRQAGPRGRRL